jgi:cytosine/adenosine deaminase-related metal-dependent hydrolase
MGSSEGGSRKPALLLRNAQVFGGPLRDIAIQGGRVRGKPHADAKEVDLEGATVVPALVNAHDHLDLSTAPPLGNPPYPNAHAWAEAFDGLPDSVRRAFDVPLPDRLFLGGLRNLLAGAGAVAHHGPFHRSLARPDFPVRVLERYGFAVAPGLTPHLRKTYRTTDRRIPWLVHVAEGTDARSRGELDLLVDEHLLRQNTVLIHGVGLVPEDGVRIAAAKSCLVWCPEANRRLYGATAPVAALHAAGVRIGHGSDSPLSGTRDLLSSLAGAVREGAFSPQDTLSLATEWSAEVARLPVGGFEEGDPADLLVLSSLEAFLSGERPSLRLSVVRGQPVYGAMDLLDRLGVRSRPIVVDGAPRALEARLARRTASLGVRGPKWLEGLSLG